MPADDTPDQLAPSTTDEPQEDDVEGHGYSLTQDPDFDNRAVSTNDSDPPESAQGV